MTPGFPVLANLLLFSASGVIQDTLVVQADGPPEWGDEPRLVEELRIGSLSGDERYTFGLIAGVAVARDGSIWVSDRTLGTIRRYSPGGSHLGDVGRRGEGPGEFNYLMDIRLLPDGMIAVWDPLNTRIHIFNEGGEFDSDLRVRVRGMYNIPQNFEVDSAGYMYGVALDPPASGSQSFRAYWLQIDREGQLKDTVFMAPSDQDRVRDPVRTQTALSPLGYAVWGRNDEYAFHRGLQDGRIVRIQRSFQPVEYDRVERAEAQEWEEVFAERRGIEPRRIPREKPVWSSFEVDADGRYWIERYAAGSHIPESASDHEARERSGNPAREWGQTAIFDVLGPDGRFYGTVRFPGSARAGPRPAIDVALARGDSIWTVERGDFDEQYVVQYRIVRSGPGSL